MWKASTRCSTIREVTKLPESEGARSCPRSHHTSSNQSSSNLLPSYLKERWATRSRLSPLTHTRPSSLREAGPDPPVRLRLSADRQRGAFGYCTSGAARREDSMRGYGDAAENSTRS